MPRKTVWNSCSWFRTGTKIFPSPSSNCILSQDAWRTTISGQYNSFNSCSHIGLELGHWLSRRYKSSFFLDLLNQYWLPKTNIHTHINYSEPSLSSGLAPMDLSNCRCWAHGCGLSEDLRDVTKVTFGSYRRLQVASGRLSKQLHSWEGVTGVTEPQAALRRGAMLPLQDCLGPGTPACSHPPLNAFQWQPCYSGNVWIGPHAE